jgi:hypothetical protein
MSDQEVIIRVFDIIGGPLCVSTDDGQIVHDKISAMMKEGKRVVVSFDKVETIISAFLNVAIGQLYGTFDEGQIHNLLSVRYITEPDLSLLKRVVENAKVYFANRDKFDEAWQQELGEGDADDEE